MEDVVAVPGTTSKSKGKGKERHRSASSTPKGKGKGKDASPGKCLNTNTADVAKRRVFCYFHMAFLRNAGEACKSGNDCPFDHAPCSDEEWSKLQPPGRRFRSASPDKRNEPPPATARPPQFCINFLKGKCGDQDQCRFLHWSQDKVDQHKALNKSKAAAAPKGKAKAEPGR